MDLIELTKHPERMDRDTLYELRSQVALYPYHQTLRLLMLQNLYLLHDPGFDEELRRAAIYITDRRVLFNMVEAAHYQHPSHQNTPNTPNTPKTLLHISCFDERAKNIRGLLLVIKMLAVQRQDFQLVLIGTGVDYAEVRAFADSLHLPEGLLVWTGELTPREVAEWLHKADALVLSSRYETYGVVLAEAAAAGAPILSTPVGIAEETADLIVPHEIAQNKPGRFAEFIESLLWSTGRVAGKKQNTARFTAAAVGNKLKAIYEQVQTR